MKKCRMCGRILTQTEEKYYEYTCEDCAKVLMDSMIGDSDYPWWVVYIECYRKRVWKWMTNAVRKLFKKQSSQQSDIDKIDRSRAEIEQFRKSMLSKPVKTTETYEGIMKDLQEWKEGME